MKSMQLRPRFELELPYLPADLQQHLRDHMHRPDVKIDASILDQYAVMRVPENDQHFWSPQLNLTWDETETPPTFLHGRFSPRPSVWTMFAFFYVASVFLGVMGLIFGLAQLQLGKYPGGLWAVPISMVFVILAYIIAYSGQKLGEEQMDELRSELDQALSTRSG